MHIKVYKLIKKYAKRVLNKWITANLADERGLMLLFFGDYQNNKIKIDKW